MNPGKHKLSDYSVIFDFDNTITPFDVLDDIIKCFSINRDWIKLERRWKAGRISSKECLRGQLRSVRVTKERLSNYLAGIKVVPYFHRLIDMLKKNGVKTIISSDSFSFIIKSILKNNRINGIKVYSNRIDFHKERLVPLFPYEDRDCKWCACCKKKHLKMNSLKSKIIIYVGDGLSDLCPAHYADIVFAKRELLRRLRREKNKKIRVMPFKDFRDIYLFLKRS